MKLSKTQLDVLKELNQEGVFIHCDSGLNFTGFFHGSMKNVGWRTIQVLQLKGFVMSYDHFASLRHKVKITDAGKKFLSELA